MSIKSIGHYDIECLGDDYYDNGLNYTAFTFTKFNDNGEKLSKVIVYVYCPLGYTARGFTDLFQNEKIIEAFLRRVKDYARLEYNYKTKQIRMHKSIVRT